jgi:uncharacterized protein (TIGR03905 family)
MLYIDYNVTPPIDKEINKKEVERVDIMPKYHTQGVCSSQIDFDIENGFLKNVHFTDGCPGNLEAIGKLVEGMPVKEVSKRLRGIVCQNGTSCADQLVIALEEVLNKQLATK